MRDITFNGQYPVARFSSVRACGIDETRSAFRRLVREHDILTFGKRRCLAEIAYAPLRKLAVSSVRLDTGLTAKASEAQDSTLIFSLVDGDIEIGMGGGRFNVRKNRIVVVPAGVPFSLAIPDGNRSMILEIDHHHLCSFMGADAGSVCRRLMELNLDADLIEARASVARLLHFLCGELKAGSPQLHDSAFVGGMEDLVARALISALQQGSARRVRQSDVSPLPSFIRRTIDYMHAHADGSPTLETLARVATTSPRTLIRGFNRHLGQSPIAYLRDLRLQRAHEELCAAHADDLSVTAVAHKWNFCHLGRFSALYRRKFGERPADSLRNRSRRVP